MIKNLATSVNKNKKSFACFNNSFDLDCYDLRLPVSVFGKVARSIKFIGVRDLNLTYDLHQINQIIGPLKSKLNLSKAFLDSIDSMTNSKLVVHGIIGMDLIPSLVPLEVTIAEKMQVVKIHDGLIPCQGELGAFRSIMETKINRAHAHRKYVKPTAREVSCALTSNNVAQNRFALLEDFVVSDWDKQFTVSNSYADNDLEDNSSNSGNYENFIDTISFENGNYSVEVPFNKSVLEKVPDNFEVCKILARKVHSKLRRQGLADEYYNLFEEQLNEGVVSRLEEGFDIGDHKFIPHFPIIRKDPLVLTTKIRAVFNCSFRNGSSPSLNDAVEFPPDLMADLIDLFLYFRTNRYYITADIKSAFLNVKFSRVSDSRMFSFVVYNIDRFHYFRYTSALFGFVLSPYFLLSVLRFHASLHPDPQIASCIRNNFYSDNLVLTGQNKKELSKVAGEITDSLGEAGFHLRQWTANFDKATEYVNSDDSELNTLEPYKLLGFVQNPSNDTFNIRKFDLDSSANTKRKILSEMQSIFDPCGYLLPCTSLGKIILRELTKAKLEWDEQIPSRIAAMWFQFVNQMKLVKDKIEIPRCAYESDKPFKLSCFCDASKELIACSVYVTQNGHTNLLFAKNKLTPASEKTMPTLELLSLELGVKVVKKLTNSRYFQPNLLESVQFYSDSQVALTWLLNRVGPKKNVLACNRIRFINIELDRLKNKGISFDINYIQTNQNIADLITRVLTMSRLKQVWPIFYNGYEWLNTNTPPLVEMQSIPSKYIKDKKLIYQVAVNEPALDGSLQNIIDVNRYSSYDKLVNTVAYVFKFVHVITRKPVKSLVEHRACAITYLLKKMQAESFAVELNYLQKRLATKNPPRLVLKLRLYLDEQGLIRSKGRIRPSALLNFDAVNPVLVSGKTHLAKLLIERAHEQCRHMGSSTTLYNLRNSGFWITHARASVNKVLSQCYICLKSRAQTFLSPSSPELPSYRTESLTPFSSIGIDYTGSFLVKDFSGKQIKVYILLITCLTTRAVHLQLVNTMSVADFLNAFVRFTNLYGVPQFIISDHAKTFKTAGNLLKTVIEHDVVQNYFLNKNIYFSNIPIYQPNYGGTWERMVGVVKKVMFKSLRQKVLTYDEFLTLLSDAEVIINNRPLFYNNAAQDIEIVSPNLFLKNNSSFPLLKFSSQNLDTVWELASDVKFLTNINRQIEERRVNNLNFLQEWLAAYLVDLRAKHGLSSVDVDGKLSKWVTVGSICWLKLPVYSDSFPLVKIIELLPSSDSKTRTVRVQKGDRSEVVVNITKLVPLEILSVGSDIDGNLSDLSHNQNLASDNQITSTRPLRAAAKESRQKVRKLAQLGYM